MVQVKVAEGLLAGELIENELGGHFIVLKESLTRNLQLVNCGSSCYKSLFQAPQPKIPWDGIRDATVFGPISYQIDFREENAVAKGAEDCLYLNVYTPDINPINPLAVMFYIHGGGLTSGSGNDDMYGPEFLIRHGIVLVTMNYRLEILGFLCLDSEDVPGNAGVKDQVAALKWVNENIANFGGDPKNITIFGHSAGGCCINYHLISPMTKGLFQRAIVKSGSFNSPWGQTFEPREKALALARKLGFHSEDNKELYEFFKSQPIESLVGKQLSITFSEKAQGLFDIIFGVVDEKQFGNNERFIYGDFIEQLRNGVHEGVDLIMGYTEDEGLINLRSGISLEDTCTLSNGFREFFVPKSIALNCTLAEQFEVGRRMKRFYFNDEPVTINNLKQLIKFLSLNMFTNPMFQLARSCSKKNKLYFYKFTGKSERNFMVHLLRLEEIVGDKIPVCHADELNYVFPMKKANLELNKEAKSFKIIENITKLWTNFAKYGNPTPREYYGFEWTPYKLEDQAYLEIDENLTMGYEPDKAEVDFWENIYREFLPTFLPY